jgi:FKBP-type peptidyl-prolyl cis-trans isomerase SlyD
MRRILLILALAGLVFNLPSTILKAEGGDDMAIEDGKKVTFEYTLTVDGEVVDSSKDHAPLEYIHGSGQIIPGLANQLEGLKKGDEKEVAVPPEEAYGQVNPEAFREVPKEELPKEVKPEVGMLLQAQTSEGQVIPAKITEVKEDSIILDLNHPLAGKTLNFEVVILSVE